MKKLIILFMFVLLTGCVTYYYPETSFEDGVYYAEDDPSYVLNSGDFSGDIYYPWSSLDYFYMGYWPYNGYGFAYGYPFGLAYSPWGYHYGYYGYFSPRYYAYHHHPYRRSYKDNCVRRSNCGSYSGDSPDNDHNRFTRDDNDNLGDKDNDVAGTGNSSIHRYVSTAPSGNQGLIIRKRDTSKTGKSRLEPTGRIPVNSVSATPSTSSTALRSPAVSTRSSFPENNTRSVRNPSPVSQRSSTSRRSSRQEDRD